MNYEQQMKEVKKLIKNNEYNLAEAMLLSMLEETDIKDVDNGENTYYCCKNNIEWNLLTKYYKMEKENIQPEVDLAEVYAMLAQVSVYKANFGNALEYLTFGLRWNPADVDIMFQMAEIYRILGHYEKYIVAVQSTYNYIYESYYLAEYYRRLAWYYIYINKLDVARALYVHSFDFDVRDSAVQEFRQISELAKSTKNISSKAIKALLVEEGIPSTYNEVVLAAAVEEYMRWKQKGTRTSNFKFTSRVLYDMTKNKKYMLYVTLKDEAKGIATIIPETWAYVKKSNYKKLDLPENVAFKLKTDLEEEIEVVALAESKSDDLETHVASVVNLLKENGHKVLTIDKTVDDKEMIQIVFDTELEQGLKIRTVDTYVVVNDLLLSTKLNFTNEIDIKDIYSDSTYLWYMDVIKSIQKI